MADFDWGGGFKQQSYPWASNAPAGADEHHGRPARSHFWVIPAFFLAFVVVFVLLAMFAPEDPPPPGGSPASGPAASALALG